MNKYLLFIFLFLTNNLFATHNRAGEIVYRQISQYTYEITVYTYTNTAPGIVADRPELTVYWGDNTNNVVPRIEQIYLPNYYKRNKYVWRHTFPGAGTYQILMEDPNRNDGIKNITGSVNVMFAIKTTLQINPAVGFNNTPVLLNPPYDKAYKGKVFVHNPAAYDPDGDSISYKLTTCLGDNGKPLQGEFYVPKNVRVDSITGDLIWDVPEELGKYNFAMAIEEWRNGVKIGQIIRDMQVEVYDTKNKQPKIEPLRDICVMAGNLVRFDVHASDEVLYDTIERPDHTISIKEIKDNLKLTAKGVPFLRDTILKYDTIFTSAEYDTAFFAFFYVDPKTLIRTYDTISQLSIRETAIFAQSSANAGIASGTFLWKTGCSQVRKRPFQIIFKVEDDYQDANANDMHLFDYKIVNITVVAPAPKNVKLEPTYSSFRLTWDAAICRQAIGYKIYRRKNKSDFNPSECLTGLPASAGYEQIATLTNINDTTYLDNNNEMGLLPGVVYCYRIVAYYPDGSESYVSSEVCDEIIRGIPIITNVDVKNTDTQNGSILLKWAEPLQIDIRVTPGPYKYLIYRSIGIWGKNFQLIDSVEGLSNTEYIDNKINTKDSPYSYKVEFWNDSPGNRFLVGRPQIASSNYLKIIAGQGKSLLLSLDKNVPWNDTLWVIYKMNEKTNQFDSIGVSNNGKFIDYETEFRKNYCYFIKAIGYYALQGILDPRINNSQIACGNPIDTIPPCPPVVIVKSNCELSQNELNWSGKENNCTNDAIFYNIYYSYSLDGNMELLSTIKAPINSFSHFPKITMAGCYYVTAIDSFNNESQPGEKICVDSCNYFKLPNVFTSNTPFFEPMDKSKLDLIYKVNTKIFNRWGQLVYETDQKEILWSGKYKGTNEYCNDGVYYYVCDISEYRLNGLIHRYLVGFVYLYASQRSAKP